MPEQSINPHDIIKKAGIIEGMKVADLGCGNLGYFIFPIAKIVGENGVAYAVDVQKSVLDAVENKARQSVINNVETVWANLEKEGSTPINDNSLDVALLINVLFQNKNKKQLIKESARMVKSGGKLVIADWQKINIPFGPPVELRVDKNEIIKEADALGLQLLEKVEFSDYFWGLIYQIT